MSETYPMTTLSKIRHVPNPLGREARYKRRFARALQAWPSADALCADLEEQEIYRDVRTCTRYRAGETLPPAWLHDKLLEMSVIQTRQQIKALQQRLEEIGG